MPRIEAIVRKAIGGLRGLVLRDLVITPIEK